MGKQADVVPFGETDIQAQILTVRGMQVMLDRDLAELYGGQFLATVSAWPAW